MLVAPTSAQSPAPAAARRRVAIVLGAGGPVGHAFHAGVLAALSRVMGWAPDDADLLLGTSAGAQVAALVRAGMSPRDLMARCTGEPMSSHGADIAECFVRPHSGGPPPEYRRRWWRPAAPRYLLRSLLTPWTLRLRRFVAALLPAGGIDLDPMAAGLRRLFGERWSTRPLWVTAVNLWSGRRVAFGRSGAPATDVGSAVASSGAVPGLCAPVLVGGSPHIDGGFASTTSVDLLYGERYEQVIISAPLSMYRPLRLAIRRRASKLQRLGSRVLLLEPRGEALARMGYNPMDAARAPAVTHAAFAQALGELEQAAPSLAL
ncbi:MAG: patatin-like phospholipase family protein [Myxococcales bacterium]|nr:patatin-like phospholipase family protein [Myxococcales bacterium]